MRRMYSENQLIKIISDNVSKATELLNGAIYIDENTNVIVASVLSSPKYVVEGTGFASIVDEDGNTLQGALDGKSDKLYEHHCSIGFILNNVQYHAFLQITNESNEPLFSIGSSADNKLNFDGACTGFIRNVSTGDVSFIHASEADTMVIKWDADENAVYVYIPVDMAITGSMIMIDEHYTNLSFVGQDFIKGL